MMYVDWPAIASPGAAGTVVVVVAGTVGMVTKLVVVNGMIVVLLEEPVPLPHAPSASPPATTSPATMRRERMGHQPTGEPPPSRGTPAACSERADRLGPCAARAGHTR